VKNKHKVTKMKRMSTKQQKSRPQKRASSSKHGSNLETISTYLKSGKKQFVKGLLLLEKINDWPSIGYESRKDFLKKKHPELDYHAVSAILNAAKTEQRFFGTKSIGNYSMNAMRSLKKLDDTQIEKFLKFANEQWEEEGRLESTISPDWLTRAKVEEIKSSLFKQHKGKNSGSSRKTKKSSSTNKTNGKKDFEKKTKKLKSALSKHDESSDFLKVLIDFLLQEYNSPEDSKLLKKASQRLQQSITEIKSNRNLNKKKGRML